jgi:hypothetical protein
VTNAYKKVSEDETKRLNAEKVELEKIDKKTVDEFVRYWENKLLVNEK